MVGNDHPIRQPPTPQGRGSATLAGARREAMAEGTLVPVAMAASRWRRIGDVTPRTALPRCPQASGLTPALPPRLPASATLARVMDPVRVPIAKDRAPQRVPGPSTWKDATPPS